MNIDEGKTATMRIPPQVNAVSIVLLGHFNPIIFRPEWFRDKSILIGSDFDEITIDIINPEIVQFRLSWDQLNVTRDRFLVTVVQEPIIRVQDFFVSSFQRLPETPVSALGLNREVHFDCGSVQAMHKIGDLLGPKEFWGDFVTHDGKRAGGLRALTMEQSILVNNEQARLDGKKGWIRVQVEPSARIVPTGMFVQVNDHYNLTSQTTLSDARGAADIVAADWTNSTSKAEGLIDRVMGIIGD
jgi:hypothetical protein